MVVGKSNLLASQVRSVAWRQWLNVKGSVCKKFLICADNINEVSCREGNILIEILKGEMRGTSWFLFIILQFDPFFLSKWPEVKKSFIFLIHFSVNQSLFQLAEGFGYKKAGRNLNAEVDVLVGKVVYFSINLIKFSFISYSFIYRKRAGLFPVKEKLLLGVRARFHRIDDDKLCAGFFRSHSYNFFLWK